MAGDTYTRSTSRALQKLIQQDRQQGDGPPSAHGTKHATRVVPFQVTSSWSQATTDGEYSCEAKRLIYDQDDDLYACDADRDAATLYAPCSLRTSAGVPATEPGQTVGSRVHAVYRGRWEIIQSDNTLRWAIATEDWNEGAASLGEGYPRVACNPCTSTGGSPDTSVEFDVWLPRKRLDVPGTPKYDRDGDPAVFENDVIGYVIDAEGNAVCVTDYMDRRVGAIEIWNGYEDRIKRGWRLCDGTDGATDLKHRFLMGVDTDTSPAARTDEDEIGDTGGHRWHGSTENNHTTHDGEASTQLVDNNGDGATVAVIDGDLWHDGSYNTSATPGEEDLGDTDNRPPYYVVAFVERFE